MLKMLSVEEKTGRANSGAALVAAGAVLVNAANHSGRRGNSGALTPSLPAGVAYARGAAPEATLRPEGTSHEGAVHEGVVHEGIVRNARVLVCDDETRLGDLTAGLLQECGFRAGFVPNAVLAMQYLEQHQDTSVLLLDVNLSGSQSTFELLTELAQRPRRPRVVLTSGSAKQDIRAELTHHPLVVGYLEKPYAEEELTSTINDAVS